MLIRYEDRKGEDDMKATKKMLSMLLLVAMCLSLISTAAYADMGGEVLVTAEMMKDDSVSQVGDVQAVQEEGEAVVMEGTGTAASNSTEKTAAVVVTHADGTESYYDGLPAALSAVVDGDVLKLNYNPSYGITLTINKKITVLLNGHTINVSVSGVNAGIHASNVTFRGGSIIIKATPVAVKENEEPPVYAAGLTGSATLDNVSLTYSGPDKMMSGVFTVYGGSYSADPSAYLPAGYEAFLADDGRYKVREVEAEEETPAEEPTEQSEETPEELPEENEGFVEVTGEETTPAEQPVEETTEGEGTAEPAEETPSEQPSEEAEEQPAEEAPVEEAPAEEAPVEETPAEEPEQTQEPEAEAKEGNLLQTISDLITGETDVDQEAKNMEHNSDKTASASGVTVTVAGAPDEAELTVVPAEGVEDAVLAAAGDMVVYLALDVNVSGELTEAVSVTLSSETLVGVSEDAKLYHVKADGTAEQVLSASFDPVNGTVTFQADSFSPYVVVVPNEMVIEDEDEIPSLLITRDIGNTVNVAGGGSVQTAMNTLEEDGTISLQGSVAWDATTWTKNKVTLLPNGQSITGVIDVPAGKTLVITGNSNNNLFGNETSGITGDGTVVLTGTLRVNGTITSSGTLQIIGRGVTVTMPITANGSVSIEGGTFTTLSGSGTGGVTGGTYTAQVPGNLITTGYQCIGSGNSWKIDGMAKVTSRDKSKDYYRGGQYVLQYGKNGSLTNYDYKFAIAPKGGLTGITLNGSALTYDLDTASETLYDWVTIPLNAGNKALLDDSPVGRVYFNFAFTTTTVEVPVNVYPNVSYTPKYYYFGTYTPIVFTLTTHGGAIDDAAYITMDWKNGDDIYAKKLPAANYTYGANTITLQPSYLETLTPGEHIMSLWYETVEGNKAIEYRCPFYVYQDYRVTQINAVNTYKEGDVADVNWYQYSGKNLSFTVNGDVSKFAGVRMDGKVVPAGNYYWASAGTGTTNVQIYPGYLASLAQGKHTVEFVFTDGVATAEISILSASASPKTGDTNNMGLWIGLLVLSGAAVVALIPKKRKQ